MPRILLHFKDFSTWNQWDSFHSGVWQMVVLYTSQEIKYFRRCSNTRGMVAQLVLVPSLIEGSLHCPLLLQKQVSMCGCGQTCATGTCVLVRWPLFWCYSSFCWRILKEQSGLSNIGHLKSTSVHVSMRDSCLKWFTLVTLVSISERSKGEKCQKWKTKKGKPRDCSDACIKWAEIAFSQVAFPSP